MWPHSSFNLAQEGTVPRQGKHDSPSDKLRRLRCSNYCCNTLLRNEAPDKGHKNVRRIEIKLLPEVTARRRLAELLSIYRIADDTPRFNPKRLKPFRALLRNPVIGSLIALAELRYDMFIKANARIKNEIAKGKICGPMVKDDWRQSLASSEPHAQDRVRIEACIDEHSIKLSGSELFEKPPPHGIELG